MLVLLDSGSRSIGLTILDIASEKSVRVVRLVNAGYGLSKLLGAATAVPEVWTGLSQSAVFPN